MLIFFIHGVNTRNSNYADALINHITKEVKKSEIAILPSFYKSFWGNLFNNKKHQTIEFIQKDGAITGRIVAYNLVGNTQKLLERCVTPK